MASDLSGVHSTKLFRIPETDLATLEKALAVLHEAVSLSPAYARPDVQVAIEECKRILSDVRWDYGPYSHVERLPAPPLMEDDDA